MTESSSTPGDRRTAAPLPGWRGLSFRGLTVRLFLTCWIVYGLHFATNTVREIYPALALGDHASFDVSEYVGLHPDIFELPGRGAYINSNPGASILGAVPYVLTRPVIDPLVGAVQQRRAEAAASGAEPEAREYDTVWPLAQEFYRESRRRGLDIKFGLGAGVMQALLMAPLSALSAVVVFGLLARLTGDTRESLLLALLYAFATPVFYRTAQLNHNLLLAHCALFSFVLLYRPWDTSGSARMPHAFAAGLLAGYTVVLDYSGLIACAALGFYAFARWWSLPPADRPVGDALRFVAGVALSGAVLIAYQWTSFGHPLYPAQHYMPTTTFSHRGYQGMDWPRLDLLLETAFSPRYGLFVSAPFLLLGLWVPGWWRDDPGRRVLPRREVLFCGLFTAAFFGFCSANQFGHMQFNTGVRHVVPVVPFLFLLAAAVFRGLPGGPALAFATLATYWSWCLAMYRDVEQGLGVLESLRHISTGGPRLPWLSVLEGMGYVSAAWVAPTVLAVGAVLVACIWRPAWRAPRAGSEVAA